MVTGGAGFVGSHLALSFKRDMPHSRVIALDNLRRRGSELVLRSSQRLFIPSKRALLYLPRHLYSSGGGCWVAATPS
jgi:nucleoside-diphosphate-sugar epimerase